MAKNKVILTGFMGCGKSTIGRILAEKRGQELLDTDYYIEQKQGRSISDIFATQGEEAFRDLESQALAELTAQGATQSPAVLSTGGGIVLRPANRLQAAPVLPTCTRLKNPGTISMCPGGP